MNADRDSLQSKGKPLNQDTFRAELIYPGTESGALRFEALLNLPGISVYDEILSHTGELIKTRNPGKRYTPAELHDAVLQHIGFEQTRDYGVWVYYAWSNRLVHIPDREEFIEIRTSRNLYKITPEERGILAQKKIGVIGLSVGQSVAITLCIERICGEIRLADFDVLELTNLNRIRTGIHNLGLPKVYAAAREIAEIDPFINVKCYPEGATSENLDAFLLGDGKLDLLIEESDGMDIKVLSRLKAKEYKIPVLMEASDRCMVDVERYDLDSGLGILHGILDNLDLETLRNLKSNEEKIPYMLDIAGLNTASTRIKASMLEIEQTINTWPQLASAVAMGGGVVADVSRRILLNQYTQSGRYHIDLEELIGDPATEHKEEQNLPVYTDAVKLCHEINREYSAMGILPDPEHITRIVEAAVAAPSGGNYQPWIWVKKDNALLLFHALDTNHVFLGYGNIASHIALGASAENAVLQAAAMGYNTNLVFNPIAHMPELEAEITFTRSANHPESELRLASGLFGRHTNRLLDSRKPVAPETLELLFQQINSDPGAKVHWITDSDALLSAGEILGEIEKIRLVEKMGHRDFSEEFRWTQEENERQRDGIDIQTMELTQSELAGLKIAREKNVMDYIRQWKGGNAFKKLVKKSVDAASAIGILSVSGTDAADYFHGGRILERLWIAANQAGFAFQPLSSSLFIYARLMEGKGEGISAEGQAALHALKPAYDRLFAQDPGRGQILIFRLSLTDKVAVRSLRRPLETCFISLS